MLSCKLLARVGRPVIRLLEFLGPLSFLGIRLWVADVFFRSGWNKLQGWETTLSLFEDEYQVPYLDPAIAAYLGTAVELTAPVFLALGLGARWAALVLFAFNIAAVISYPALEEAGIQQHQLWGLMLALICCYGPGKLSFDHFFRKRCLESQPQIP